MIKLKKILCPTDLTSESDRALRYAYALSCAFGAEFLLCHCADKIPDFSAHEILKRKLVNSLREQAGAVQPPRIECEPIALEGDPAEKIVQLATDCDADLIIMCSRRKSNATALLGSTTEAVMRKASCPVLVIHPDEREWVGKTMCEIDLHRILLAHDFSKDSEIALKYALMLAQEFQTELHMIHVLPVTLEPAIATLPKGIESDFQNAAALLQQAVPEEAYLWCRVKQAVKTGQPDKAILAYANEHDIDLICMGVHGTGFVKRALFGSNAHSVLGQAKCPVLIARPSSTNDL